MTQWPSKVRRRNLHGQHMLCVRSEMWAQGLQRGDLLKCMPFALFGSLSGTGYLVFAVRNGWHQRSFMWANLATVSKWHEITFEFFTRRTISIFDFWRDSLTKLIGKGCHDDNFSVKHTMQRCGGQGWYGLLVGFMSNSPNFHFLWVWMSECLNVVIVLIKTLRQIALTLQGFNCCVEGLTCVWGNDHYSQCLQLVDSNGKSRSSEYQLSMFHCFIVSPHFNVTMCAFRLFASL